MESKGVATRVYQDFEPSMERVPEEDSDTLLVYLPGFAKEQLRIQLRARNLIISGERKLQQNTWSRFRVEFPVSGNCDLNKISAKFEGNILFVRQPKLMTSATKAEEGKPAAIAAALGTPQKPPVDANNAGEKAEEATKAAPTMTEKKQELVRKDDDVPKKTAGEINESKKKTSTDGVVYGEVDKTALEKYRRAAGAVGMKLKTWSRGVNMIVVLVLGLAVAIYVSDSIKSWTNN